jgi:hypothetical protein
LQREERAKDILIAMSRKLEVITLQIANGGWNLFYHLPYLGALLPVATYLLLLTFV